MPVVNLNKKRVLDLLGEDVSDDTLKDRISYLGTDLEEINDSEIVVEIFPNRPDLLSEEGFSRALKSFMGFESGLRNYVVKKGDYEVIVDKSVSSVRPFTVCLVAKNLDINSDVLNNIINIQEKLHVTYGRNRKKCAIGVYPIENIVFPISYKALNPKDIVFVPLGESDLMNGFDLLKKTGAGRDYGYLLEGKKKFPVFLDSKNEVLSVPPILNSEKTGSVTVNTKDLFVECSGHDLDVLNKALNMIGVALSDMGGDIFSVCVKYDNKKIVTPDFSNDVISVNCDYFSKYLGVDLSVDAVSLYLGRMGFGVKTKKGGELDVLIPCYRSDILHPVDLVEDVCIAFGFDNVFDDKNYVYSVGKELFVEKVKEKVRDIFVGDGLIEVVNYSLLNFDFQKKNGLDNIVSIKNPNTSEFNSMRRFLFPVILKTFKNNKMNEFPQKIFESGVVFEKIDDGVRENNNLCVGICSDSASFTWVKQRLNLLGSLFNVEFSLKRKNFDFFIKGRSASILIKNNDDWVEIGFLGEVNLDVIRLYGLEHAISLFELDLDFISKMIS